MQTPPENRGLKLDWRIDLGSIITAGLLLVGFAVQYGVLSNRVAAIEVQMLQSSAANQSIVAVTQELKSTIIRVQTQIEERQKAMDTQREIDRAARDRAEIHSR